MRRDKIIEKNSILIISGILVGFIILGSFLDVSIAKFLMNDASVFRIIDAYMKLPLTAVISFIGLFIISQRNCQNMLRNIFSLVIGLVIIALGIVLLTYYTYSVVSSNLYICLGISFILNVVSISLLYRLIHDSEAEVQYRFVAVITSVLLVGLIVTYGLHYVWNRPSYVALLEDPNLQFHNWWKIGNSFNQFSIAEGLEYIRCSSFPSVSALSVSLLLLLPLFTRVNRIFRHDEQFLLVLGFALSIIFCLISLVSGMSYVSDVSITMLVMFIVEVIAIKFIYNE